LSISGAAAILSSANFTLALFDSLANQLNSLGQVKGFG
jgi:hypothetical protein